MANEKKPKLDEIVKLESSIGTSNRVTDDVFQVLPVGSLTTAIGDSFYGINHRQQPGSISINKDFYGLTFFTRPRLNLTTANIRAVRELTPLLSGESTSIQRIIRSLLDPELIRRNDNGSDGRTPFVDHQQAFIPILTNNLISMSGWPDVTAPTFTSQQGTYKEEFSIIDGLTKNYSTYDITANFRNIPGDPITALFYYWITYASNVYQGTIVPYSDMIINNEVDYNTRIYRLVLDSSKRRVQKIAACGAAFPWSTPLGAAFNFESDRPLNNSNDQITINFRCMGAMYQDDILVWEFNRTTELFNDGLQDGKREQLYVMVPFAALGVFNNQGYPRINQDSYELEWWVPRDVFEERLPMYKQFQQNTTPAPGASN